MTGVIHSPARLTAFSWALISVLVSYQNVRGDESRVTLKTITDAWKEREERTASFELSWKETEARLRPIALELDPFGPPSAGPFKRHHNEYTRRLLIDGKRLRFEDHSPHWFLEKRAHVPTTEIGADDGVSSWQLTKQPSLERHQLRGSGGKTGAARKQLVDVLDWQPVFDHYRPTWRIIAFVKEGAVADDEEMVDDRACTVLKVRKNYFGWVEYKYCLDPKLHYAIRRIKVTVEEDGRVDHDHERQYELDKDGNELLVSWSIVNHLRTGEVDRKIEVKSSACKVNVKPADSEFVIDFPPETEFPQPPQIPRQP